MPYRSALVIGASGLVGLNLLNQILNDNDYDKVKAAVRKPLQIEHEKLEQLVINFDSISSYDDLFKADDIFCCLGTTIKKAGSQEAFIKVDYSYAFEAAKTGLVNGAEQFIIVSSAGADSDSSIFYKRVKGDTEDSISKLGYNSIKILRPSLLTGSRKEYRFSEKCMTILMSIFSFVFVGNLKKYRSIKAADVAGAMIKIAKKNEEGIKIFESDEIQRIADGNY